MREKVEVLVTFPLEDELQAQIREMSEFVNLTVAPAQKAEDIPEEVWRRTEVLYTLRILPEPAQVPKLRWVQSYLAGVEKEINHPLFEEGKVFFSSMSGANARQTAEHALTMMLALGHNLPEFNALQSERAWMEDKGKKYTPTEINGSTVGIIGYGSIGRQVARLVTGLGAQVLASKRDAMTPAHYGYSAEDVGDPSGDMFTRLYPPEAMRSMLKECDFVVVCVPRTPDTAGLVGKDQLAAMKKGAYLVDISRGGVVDQEALLAALEHKKIGGAALDVFEDEPLPEENPLWELPNVIITPHIAGFSSEYAPRANTLFLENLGRYLSGQVLLNLVRKDRGY